MSIIRKRDKLCYIHKTEYYSVIKKKQQTNNTCNIMDELQKQYAERSQTHTKNVHALRFHFYEAQEQAKLMYGDRNQNNDCLWGIETEWKEA